MSGSLITEAKTGASPLALIAEATSAAVAFSLTSIVTFFEGSFVK